MTDEKLTDLLEQAAGRTAVNPVPLTAIADGAARSRRRRWTATLGGAAAVAAVVAGTVVLLPDGGGSSKPPPDAGPAVSLDGMRLVGIGHVAIAVPEAWGTNESHCGTPQKDTVEINISAVAMCLTPRPRGVESVAVNSGVDETFVAARTYEIDGFEVQRSKVTCVRDEPMLPGDPANPSPTPTGGEQQLCSAEAYLPRAGAAFRAESSTDAAAVDAILDRIVVTPDKIAVPEYAWIASEEQDGSGAAYRQELEKAGFAVQVRTTREAGLHAGYLMDASPEPGTMLAPGSTVTITQIAEPRGPADEVEANLNAEDPTDRESGMISLDNLDIQENPTIEVLVGKNLWSYAFGKYSRTFAVALTGDALEQTGAPGDTNYPNTWVAAHPGTATLTLTIEAKGRTVRIGVVTVKVVER